MSRSDTRRRAVQGVGHRQLGRQETSTSKNEQGPYQLSGNPTRTAWRWPYGPALAQEPAAGPGTAAPLHILVAEDNEFSARLLDQLLGWRGHRVRLSSNGPETLALAQEGGFGVLPQDIHMPGLDRFRVAGTIRERERSAGGICPSSP